LAQNVGIGQVLKNGQELASVSYRLTKTAPDVTVKKGEVPRGQYSTEGALRLLRGHIPADGDMLTLRLENENEVPFHLISIENIGSPYAIYRVTVSGDPKA